MQVKVQIKLGRIQYTPTYMFSGFLSAIVQMYLKMYAFRTSVIFCYLWLIKTIILHIKL